MDDDLRKRREAERQNARDILNNPNSDQLARDLAHLRLQDGKTEEGTKGYASWVENGSALPSGEDVPQEWLTVEAFELGLASLSDEEVVALVEDPLLRNKCKMMKAVKGPDGKPNVPLAYPKLTRAAQSLLRSSSRAGPQTVASANAVMACLVRAGDRAASLQYFQTAIRIRPGDWRLRNAIASAYMGLDKVSLALEALTQASDLTPEGSFERFDVESCRSKVLFNLGRNNEAKKSLLNIVVNAEKYKGQLSAMDAGHLVPNEYMLCSIYAMEKNRKMCKHQWDSAEVKRNALPANIRQRLDWDSRQFAQTLMASLDPGLLSHQECHHCRQLSADPKRCSRCKQALYCSR